MRARAAPVTRRAPGAAPPRARPPHLRSARQPGPAADAARDDRLEPLAPDRAGAAGVPAEAMFAGGCTLADFEAVCADAGGTALDEVESLLLRLGTAAKSPAR